jgi:ribonucleoside-triphosphate reductase
VLKIRPQDFQNKESASILSLAHRLAAETGLPCFANSTTKDQTHVSYASTGTRFADNWKGDWEIDTMRTGSIDSVVINLPRIAYESDGKISTFQTLLDEQVEMALRAMEIKFQTIKLRGREGLLPFLTNKSNGDQYARFENFTRLISFVGLGEAVQSFIGKSFLRDNRASDFAEQAIKRMNENVEADFRRPESRPVVAMVPCENASRRLAQLDVERYGWAKVHARGTKEQPYYTDVVEVPADEKETLEGSLKIIGKIQKLTPGGHFDLIQSDQEAGSDELMTISKLISSDDKIGLYAFGRSFSYCSRCKKTVSGHPKKCPTCGSVDSLRVHKRTSSRYSSIAD